MPLFYKAQLQERANRQIAFAQKSAPIILEELRKSINTSRIYDVFLSHRYLDAKSLSVNYSWEHILQRIKVQAK